MHIAFDLISETGLPGGIRTYWTRLIDQLARLYPDDRWTLIGAADLVLPEEILAHDNVERIILGRSSGSPLRRRIRQQLVLPARLHGEPFDAVHSINNVLPLATTAPRVLTVLDWTLRHTPDRFSWSKRLFLQTLLPASARCADRIVSISHATRRDLLEGVPGLDDDKIHVVHLGVDERFSPEKAVGETEALRKRYRLPDAFTFFVGALEPGKNLHGMLDALELLTDGEGETPPLVVAGGGGWGEIRDRLEGASRELPVHLLGRVPDEDLPGLYRAARLFLFPSLWEGFGLPVLEAFASGTPVITSNCSALPEVAGDAAVLVDPESPATIADAWHRLWTDRELRDSLRRRGLERCRQFQWERVARGTYGAYEALTCGAAMTS